MDSGWTASKAIPLNPYFPGDYFSTIVSGFVRDMTNQTTILLQCPNGAIFTCHLNVVPPAVPDVWPLVTMIRATMELYINLGCRLWRSNVIRPEHGTFPYVQDRTTCQGESTLRASHRRLCCERVQIDTGVYQVKLPVFYLLVAVNQALTHCFFPLQEKVKNRSMSHPLTGWKAIIYSFFKGL